MRPEPRGEENTEVLEPKNAPEEPVFGVYESSLPGPGRLPRRLNLEAELIALGVVASARDWNELPRGRW